MGFRRRGRLAHPGLIDCHTHLVWAGSRTQELEQRLNGVSYQEIASAGGGIVSTVRATRAADEYQLADVAEVRLRDLMNEGVTTVEIKSGYGLDTATEIRLLQVAADLGRVNQVRVIKTFLGAHALPPEFAGRADDYIDLVCSEMLPAAHKGSWSTRSTPSAKSIAFTPEQTRRVFAKAKELGLPVKLHADQLSDSGGGALVAEFGGLSADHVEYTCGSLGRSHGQSRHRSRAAAGSLLLPAAETKKPPIEAFQETRSADGRRHRLQPRHQPLHLAAPDAPHVLHLLRPHPGRSPRRGHQKRGQSPRHAERSRPHRSWPQGRNSLSGTSTTPATSPATSAAIR